MWDPEDGTYATKDNPEINDKDGAGMRFMMPLKWAAYHGNTEICKLIVERGGKVDSDCFFEPSRRRKFVPTGGVPALSVAAMAGHLVAVKYLVEEAGADPTHTDFCGNTAADHAGNPEVQKYLWAKTGKGNDRGRKDQSGNRWGDRDTGWQRLGRQCACAGVAGAAGLRA